LKTADPKNIDSDIQSILNAADRCVACGMCLPVCPSYRIAQQESESPRGRLSLIQAYLQGSIEDSLQLRSHLDHCLLCRSCEKICPAKVPFASIMDRVQSRLAVNRKWPLTKKLLLACVKNKHYLTVVERLLRVSGFKWFLKQLSLPKLLQYAVRLERPDQFNEFYPASGKAHARVALFTGCVQSFFDPDSLKLTVRVLNHLGVDVYIPKQQACCGAMHLHSGKEKDSRQLQKQNKQAFSALPVDAIISLSSACTVTLQESAYKDLPVFIDLSTFLQQINWQQHATVSELDLSLLLHIPCTQKNILNNVNDLKMIMSHIPGLSVTEITGNCCGAAGTYMLDFPDWSQRIQSDLLENLDPGAYDYLITSNIGCQLQLENKDISVVQPITLIAHALSITTNS